MLVGADSRWSSASSARASAPSTEPQLCSVADAHTEALRVFAQRQVARPRSRPTGQFSELVAWSSLHSLRCVRTSANFAALARRWQKPPAAFLVGSRSGLRALPREAVRQPDATKLASSSFGRPVREPRSLQSSGFVLHSMVACRASLLLQWTGLGRKGLSRESAIVRRSSLVAKMEVVPEGEVSSPLSRHFAAFGVDDLAMRHVFPPRSLVVRARGRHRPPHGIARPRSGAVVSWRPWRLPHAARTELRLKMRGGRKRARAAI